MNRFLIKQGLSYAIETIQVNNLMFFFLYLVKGKKNIRIVNYHDTPEHEARNFERQLKWYARRFVNASIDEMENLISTGEWKAKKPGLMITFDDGFISNYSVAKVLLEKYGFRGVFFVSADLVGQPGYMDWKDLKNLEANNHLVGSHTSTHHRMNEQDSDECLHYEIHQSRRKMEEILGHSIDSFCWCGGEEQHYTSKAFSKIKDAGYKYSFLTNSALVSFNTKRHLLERINVESGWPLPLVKFQVSGIQDIRFKRKRNRVEQLMRTD